MSWMILEHPTRGRKTAGKRHMLQAGTLVIDRSGVWEQGVSHRASLPSVSQFLALRDIGQLRNAKISHEYLMIDSRISESRLRTAQCRCIASSRQWAGNLMKPLWLRLSHTATLCSMCQPAGFQVQIERRKKHGQRNGIAMRCFTHLAHYLDLT